MKTSFHSFSFYVKELKQKFPFLLPENFPFILLGMMTP